MTLKATEPAIGNFVRYGRDDVLVLAGLAIGLAIVGMTLGFGILPVGLDFFGQRVAVAMSKSVDAVDASALAASRT
jgi:hypothetical protein